MSVSINVNGLSLCHKGSGGVVDNTLPDVCKTPDKGIPIPYKNRAFSKDLVKGTTTCFADGGHMVANFGSEFVVSIFDEGGSMGGVVSGTNKAEADWITYSPSVFFEKKPACRLTDKMFMNHRNTASLGGEWQKDLDAALVEKICDAICECRKKGTPTGTQISEGAGDVLGAVRGVYDTTAERASNINEIHRRQACFASQFNSSGLPWSGAQPKDPKVLTEVPYKIPAELIESQTGRTTYSGGPTAPGSVQRALSEARGSPGTVVIWDMVVLNDGSKPATWDNVKKVLEVKFAGDDWTRNQAKALSRGRVSAKVERVDEADCNCDFEDELRRQETARNLKKFSDNLLKYMQFMPPIGGRRLPIPIP